LEGDTGGVSPWTAAASLLEASTASVALFKTTPDDDDDDNDDDDVYLRLQHGKGFHNLVCMFYVKHINPASKA
jgi:hypothetical protein